MKNMRKVIFSCIVSITMCLSMISTASAVISSGLKVHYINVGSGDAIYIECDGKNMLIDGGYYSDYHRDYSNVTSTHYGSYNATYDKYFFGNSNEVLPAYTSSGDVLSSYIKNDYNDIKNGVIARYNNGTDGVSVNSLTTSGTRALTADEKNSTNNAYVDGVKTLSTYPNYTGKFTYDLKPKDELKEEQDSVTVSITDENNNPTSTTKNVVHIYQLDTEYTTTYKWTNVDGTDLTNTNNVLTQVPTTLDTKNFSFTTKNAGTFKTVVTATYAYKYVKTVDKDDETKVYFDADESTTDIALPKNNNLEDEAITKKYDGSNTEHTNIKTLKQKYEITVNALTNDVKFYGEMTYLRSQFASNSNATTRYLDSIGVKHINYIVNTHPHQDHLGGLLSVLSKYTYDKLYTCGYNYYTNYAAFFSFLAEYNKTYKATSSIAYDYQTLPSQGSSWQVGGAKITVLSNVSDNLGFYLNQAYLSQNSSTKTGSSLIGAAVNNTSAILRLDYGYNSFLFTGDSQVLKQNRTIGQVGGALKTQVMSMVHHGNSNNDFATYSDKSGDYNFYSYIAPQYAIGSCGVDHTVLAKPRPKVSSDLSMAQIYTTRESGNIVVTSNGNGLTFDLQNGQNHVWYVSEQVNAEYHKDGHIKYICDTCGVARVETLAMSHKTYKTAAIVQNTMTTGGIKGYYCECGLLLDQVATNPTTKKTIYRGKSSQLLPGDVVGIVTWKSSKKSVATVNKNGVVKAKKVGKTTITMKVDGKKVATCVVTVKNKSFIVSKTKVTLKKGKTTTIATKASPNATVKWTTSNKKVATVTQAGKIKAKKKGTCKIRAKANGITRTITVRVK